MKAAVTEQEAPQGAKPAPIVRNRAGQFVASGNPAGRPASAAAALRARVAEVAPALIEQLLTAAQGGDVQAAKALLDKCLPNVKPVAAPVVVALPEQAGLAGTARAFVDAAARGDMPADLAALMVGAVASLARVTEITELAGRIAALEAIQ